MRRVIFLVSDPIDRTVSEITPLRIEQSTTRNSDEALYGADRAIDGDLETRSSTDGGGWVRVKLNGVQCVDKVRWYYISPIPQTNWTCSESSCACSGGYCTWASMEISTEGDSADGTDTGSDCKYGDTITFSFTGTFPVSFSEIKITGIVMGEWMKTGELEAYLQIFLKPKPWLLLLT